MLIRINDQNKRNTQISIAPIRIFLHKSGENISEYFICSDPLFYNLCYISYVTHIILAYIEAQTYDTKLTRNTLLEELGAHAPYFYLERMASLVVSDFFLDFLFWKLHL